MYVLCFFLQFNVTATDLLAAVDRNANQLHASLENLARLFPSHADSSDETSPLLTVRDFEAFAMATREVTGAQLIAYAPFVLDDTTRVSWEEYSVAEQSWIESSALFHPDFDVENIDTINPRIWLRDANRNPVVDPGPAPYVPIWQVSPPPSDTNLINFNLASSEEVEEWIFLQEYQNNSWSYLSQPMDVFALFGEANYPEEDLSEPASLAWVPVAHSLLSSDEDDEVAGAIVADVRWSTLLRDVSEMMFVF